MDCNDSPAIILCLYAVTPLSLLDRITCCKVFECIARRLIKLNIGKGILFVITSIVVYYDVTFGRLLSVVVGEVGGRPSIIESEHVHC